MPLAFDMRKSKKPEAIAAELEEDVSIITPPLPGIRADKVVVSE